MEASLGLWLLALLLLVLLLLVALAVVQTRRWRRLKQMLEAAHGHREHAALLATERLLMAQGRSLALQVRSLDRVQRLADAEFKVFSQYGDDGIIQYLVQRLDIPHRTFVEFGVEDYRESNTRFLLMHDNWAGLVMDGSPGNVERIERSEYFPQHELCARAAFVDCSNVNALVAAAGFPQDLGLLHIDVDGNDYWLWECLEAASPIVVILEYNAVFGPERAITIPYDPAFQRTRAHPSNLYFGASLAALVRLSNRKGYAFVGCNSAGNNAYFVRRDHMNAAIRELSVAEGYVRSRFRESRDATGVLDFATGDTRLERIRGLPVVNLDNGQPEPL